MSNLNPSRGIFEAFPAELEPDTPFAMIPELASGEPPEPDNRIPTSAPVPSCPPPSSPLGSPFAAEPPPTDNPKPTIGVWPEPIAPAPFAPAPAPSTFADSPPSAPLSEEPRSDSHSIRQLELRAIFGVDRELNSGEILQLARSLPGIRHVARVPQKEMAAIDTLRSLLPSFGFTYGPVRLVAGSTPLEFIREGQVMLAVQTDDGFTPGIRETLMIIARELSRLD